MHTGAGREASSHRASSEAAGKPDFTGIWDRRNPLTQPSARTGGRAQSPAGPQFAAHRSPLKPEFKAAYEAE